MVGVSWLLLKGGSPDKPSLKVSAPAIQKGVSEATAKSFSGVYQVESYTENEGGCDAPGAEPRGASKYLALETANIFGTRAVQVVGCSDPVQCEDTRNKIRAGKGGNTSTLLVWLIEEESPTRLVGFNAMGGFPDPDKGHCFKRFYENLLLTMPETGVVRLEARKKNLPNRPLENNGCSLNPEAVKAEAAPLPCGAIRIVTARKMP